MADKQTFEPDLFSLLPAPADSTRSIAGRIAARSIGRMHIKVIGAIDEHGPMTLFELCNRLGKYPHQLSGRITELKSERLIEPTGERRCNPMTGSPGEVYRLTRTGLDRASELDR